MQDFLGGGLEAEFLVLVIGGGVKEKRTLRCAAAGGGVAVVPSRFSWSEPTMTERRRGRAGLAGALEERIPPVPDLSGDSAKGAGEARGWCGVADLGAPAASPLGRTSLTDTGPQIEPYGHGPSLQVFMTNFCNLCFMQGSHTTVCVGKVSDK